MRTHVNVRGGAQTRSARSGGAARATITPAFLRVKVGDPWKRINVLLVLFTAVALLLGLRCMYVQGLDLEGRATQALSSDPQPIPADRGVITDRNGAVLAESQPAVNITADPNIVATNGLEAESMDLSDRLRAQAGPGIIAGVLLAYLGGDFQSYYDKLTTTKTEGGNEIRYTMLAGTVLTSTNLQVTEHLEGLGYVGLYREQAPVRNYPNGTVAANVLGYMNHSDELAAQGKYPKTGAAGIELSLNETLTGLDGQEMYESSPYGRIPTDTSVVTQPTQGVSYQTTLDVGLQYMQDQRLADAVLQSGSVSGTAITLSVKTGEVLAMSTYPTFDPNNYGNVTADQLGNRAVSATYEPGSVQKVLTLAAVVDQGLAAVDTRVIVPGQIESGDSVISDYSAHDTLQLTAAGVMAVSSNVGTLLLTRQLSKATLASYLTDFGLGAPTGIGLPGEESGFVPDADMSDQTRDNISFGQGLSVTAIQEAAAVAAIANGGLYVSPTIIKSGVTSDGVPVAVPQPITRQVISPQASRQVLDMMETVVVDNPNTFDIEGYRTAGKSGTAEAVDPACGCYRLQVMSYVGVAPAEDPQLLTYVVLEFPSIPATGTSIAAPVVRNIMEVALPLYAVPTSTTPAPQLPTMW